MQDKAYQELLDSAGLSNTKSRRLLFHLLAGSHKPLSLPELIRSTEQSMDKTTVYRTIESFEEAGIVRRVSTGWKQSFELSEQFRHHHHQRIESAG